MSIEVPRRALVEGSASQLYTRLRLSDNFTNVMQDISPDVRVDQSQLEIDFDNDTSDEHNYRRSGGSVLIIFTKY